MNRKKIIWVVACLVLFFVGCALARTPKQKLGEWIIDADKISTMNIELVIGKAQKDLELIIGAPDEIEPTPYSYSAFYDGYLSLNYDYEGDALFGVSFLLDKRLPDSKGTHLLGELASIKVFGLQVDPGVKWQSIADSEDLKDYEVLESAENDIFGITDGVFEAYFHCLPDSSGLVYMVEYFKREDPNSI